jgi:hypothetical protein
MLEPAVVPRSSETDTGVDALHCTLILAVATLSLPAGWYSPNASGAIVSARHVGSTVAVDVTVPPAVAARASTSAVQAMMLAKYR